MNKICAVFGHRKIDKEDKLYLKDELNKLFTQFINDDDNTFLFGSNSEFNDLCYDIITDLKDIYPQTRLIGYLCASEVAFTMDEKIKYLNYIEKRAMRGIKTKIYDNIKQFAFENRNLYIERNKKMIEDADICIFYYKQDKAINNKGEKTSSGTKIAFEYAKLQNKSIIILK